MGFPSNHSEKAKANIAAESEELAPIRAQYDAVMETCRQIVETVVDIDTANRAVKDIPNLAHALTSKKEASAMLKAKTDSLGLKYTPEGYVRKEG